MTEQRPSKEMVQRYYRGTNEMWPNQAGDWVLYSDYERLRTALTGIQSCSTCEACRGAATLALGSAMTDPRPLKWYCPLHGQLGSDGVCYTCIDASRQAVPDAGKISDIGGNTKSQQATCSAAEQPGDLRASFEAYVLTKRGTAYLARGEEYHDPFVQEAWEAWRAARAFQPSDAARWAFFRKHHMSDWQGKRLHAWLIDNVLRADGIDAAIDEVMAVCPAQPPGVDPAAEACAHTRIQSLRTYPPTFRCFDCGETVAAGTSGSEQ